PITMDGIPASTSYPPRRMLRCLPTANSDRYMPVRMLMVPPMISTPTVIARVPRMAFSRPPPVPVVSVVSTLHWKCGTARTMTPPASHTVGAITRARQTKPIIQNPELAIYLRSGTSGHSNVLPLPAAAAPGDGEADALGVPLIATAPYRPEGRSRTPAGPAAGRVR